MILFPRPRVFLLIALALAIPTYGISLAVFFFYFVFKRPYDSRATSLILARAKNCLETGFDDELFRVNRAAISRVFSRFSVPAMELTYGSGAPFIHWGVLVHPMINGGAPFSLRITRSGDDVKIEAKEGEDWTILKED
jgi:hypothetical protein